MSPTVLQIGGYSFRFYASDHDEPPHIHIYRAGNSAKFWLDPIVLAKNNRFRPHELSEIQKLVESNLGLFMDAWADYFGKVDHG